MGEKKEQTFSPFFLFVESHFLSQIFPDLRTIVGRFCCYLTFTFTFWFARIWLVLLIFCNNHLLFFFTRELHLRWFNLFHQNKEDEDGESKKEDTEDKSEKSNGTKEEDDEKENESEKGETEAEKKEEAEEVGNSKESDKEDEEEKNSEVELSPSHIPSAPPQETIQGP